MAILAPAPQSWGLKNWEKTTHRTLQAGSWTAKKFLVCYYSPKMICKTEGDVPIVL